MRTDRSRKLFARARKVIPGGVSSPVRAFKTVGGTPRFLESGKGAVVTDVDGNRYLDYVGAFGPLILGHAHPAVVKALRAALPKGTSFGAPTEAEVELSELVVKALPGVDRVRFVSSGTEATMSAIRLARAATGRSRILKFEGNYHGHVDALLLGAGSGVATLGIPGTPGVPQSTTELTLQAGYNDLEGVREAFRRNGSEIACAIVEPVAGNMGCVLPEPGFLEGLRKECDAAGALLVFDEVMTGFRVAWGGAQRRYEVRPDLTCLGKVVGGGLPAAAFAGPKALMDQVAPEGPVYQSGTLSGNPLAMAAGRATLERLSEPGTYELLEERTRSLVEGLGKLAAEAGVPLTTASAGGMFGVYFHPGPVRSLAEAKQGSEEQFRRFFAAMLERGIYLAPSPYEAGFLSLAHRKREIDRTLDAAREAFRRAARVR